MKAQPTFVVMARRERAQRADALAHELLCDVVYDPEPDLPPSAAGTWRTARLAWLHATRYAHTTHAVVIQDDVKLCDHFTEKAIVALTERTRDVVTFFSRRAYVEKAAKRGERWALIPAGDFLMAQAVALPMPSVKHFVHWADLHCAGNAGDDLRLREWMRSVGRDAWATVPSLVDHDEKVEGLIGNRSNKNRQARMFAGRNED